jgi:hypothetical protein
MHYNLEGLCGIFSLFAAWAWIKSALLSGKWGLRSNFIDKWLNKISTDPVVWNAIAAGFAACAAICQGILYLLIRPI